MLEIDLESMPDSAFTAVIDECVSLGLFHDSRVSLNRNAERDDLETYRKHQKDPNVRKSFDVMCQLIYCRKSRNYYTREGLINIIVDELDRLGGKKSKQHLCETLDIQTMFLETGSPLLNMLPTSVQPLGTDLVSDTFWTKTREYVVKEVNERGTLDVVKLANQIGIPMDILLAKVVSRIDGAIWIEASQELASSHFIQKMRSSIIQYFQSLEEPVVIAKACSEHSWDVRLALDWLIEETKKNNISGVIHIDADSTNNCTATFNPFSYTASRHIESLQFLGDNGFITKPRASRYGLSLSKIAQLTKDNHDDILAMNDILIIRKYFRPKIQTSIQLCIETGMVVDLQDHLPVELVRSDIILELLKEAQLSSDQGIPVISDGKAVLVGKLFLKEVQDVVVGPTVQNFAQRKAEEIMDEKGKHETSEDQDEMATRGGKKNKSRSRKAKGRQSEKRTGDIGVVPMQQVARRMIEKYAQFPIVDALEEDISSISEAFTWGDEGDSGFLLIEFCKSVLYTDALRSQCQSALEAELERLESAKISKARLSRKEVATKLRNIESEFEDSFVTLCYMIQASLKFYLFASGCDAFDQASLTKLQNELLLGYCADLTSLITQYCLYKTEEEPLFTFNAKVEEEKNDVKVAEIRPIGSYLSCPPPREPLVVLRESLDGNKGVVLARQWIFCGGESYLGGVRPSEKGGEPYIREGSIDAFLNHVQDNCLTLCGYPFIRKLDKKAEKKLLFSRRMALMTFLQKTAEPRKVLDFTVMLLFQQVKSFVVYGELLQRATLKALVREKKISKKVAHTLESLKEKIEKGSSVSDEHLNAVKECGLCKDIAKHEITFSLE